MSGPTATATYGASLDPPSLDRPTAPFHHFSSSVRISPTSSVGTSPRTKITPWSALSPDERAEMIRSVRLETETLKREIAHLKNRYMDATLSDTAASTRGVPYYSHRMKQIFKGHSGKVYQMRLTSDCQYLVSVGQDEFVIIWDAHSSQKVDAIQLSQSFATTCAVNGICTRLAVGGLANSCSIYSLDDYDEQRTVSGSSSSKLQSRTPLAVIKGHSELISEVIFVSDEHIATSSSDMTIRIWDANRGEDVIRYDGHLGGVNAIVGNPTNHNLLGSVSVDRTVKLWDRRARISVNTFFGHFADVNLVRFFPDGNTIVSSSDDGTIRFFDLRSDCQLDARYVDPSMSISALEFTPSGRVLLTSFTNGDCGGLDVLKGQWISSIEGHTGLISSICVAPEGRVYTSSWDATLRSWHPVV
jgi:WD40 repeat protein